MNSLHDVQIFKRDWVSAVLAATDRAAEFDFYLDSPITVIGKNLIESLFAEWNWDVVFPSYFFDGQHVEAEHRIFSVRASSHEFVQKEFYVKEILSKLFSLAHNSQKIFDLVGSTTTTLVEPRYFFSSDVAEKEILFATGVRPRRLFFKKCILVTKFHVDNRLQFYVEKLRESLAPTIKIEYLASSLEEVLEADRAGVDYISLQDFSVKETAMAVRTVRGRSILEMTGRYVNEDNLSEILETKIDCISADFILKMPQLINVIVRS